MYVLNKIARGFAMCSEARYARKSNVCQVLNIEDIPKEFREGEMKMPKIEIVFLEKDAAGIHPHNEDPMVGEIIGKSKSSHGPRELCRCPLKGDISEALPRSRRPKSLKVITNWILRGASTSERLHNVGDHIWSGRTSQ